MISSNYTWIYSYIFVNIISFPIKLYVQIEMSYKHSIDNEKCFTFSYYVLLIQKILN
jgi:hypothetical protein